LYREPASLPWKGKYKKRKADPGSDSRAHTVIENLGSRASIESKPTLPDVPSIPGRKIGDLLLEKEHGEKRWSIFGRGHSLKNPKRELIAWKNANAMYDIQS
jgi:hypothetical protein